VTATVQQPPRRRVQPTDEHHRVTTLELFFDLVFVFAITQVTTLMADDLSGRGAARGLVVIRPQTPPDTDQDHASRKLPRWEEILLPISARIPTRDLGPIRLPAAYKG